MSPSLPASVPDVQQTLLDALEAHFTGANQVVDFGLPTKVPTKRERIYLEADEEGLQRTARQAYTVETYTLRVLVEVKQLGRTPHDYHDCSDRRWELVNEVIAVVHSGAFRNYLQEGQDINTAESGSGPIEKGFVAQTRVRIPIQVRG